MTTAENENGPHLEYFIRQDGVVHEMTPASGGFDELLDDGLGDATLRSDEELLVQVLDAQFLLPRLKHFHVGFRNPAKRFQVRPQS